jgi:type III pantothenate kinase
MNFIIDIGNTNTKIALYEGDEKVISLAAKHFSWDKILSTFAPQHEKVEKAIVSTVKNTPEFIIDLATLGIPYVHVLSYRSKVPFRNEYETPETLGTDRIAALSGAVLKFPGEEILIIDAGSAITYDYLSGNSFKGGNISPGLSMRFKALHRFTGRLPLVTTTEIYISPGKNTFDAISSGVINGVIFEINEYIRAFQEQHGECKIILTGGDSGYLKSRIGYQTIYMPDIVIDGLNNILNHNAE